MLQPTEPLGHGRALDSFLFCQCFSFIDSRESGGEGEREGEMHGCERNID